MKRILFQGDSITDAERDRENPGDMGRGYPLLVRSELGYEQPGVYEFLNRGMSGNRIVDIYGRIKVDIINLKPDVMSLLIGVNDVWHEVSRKNGISAEKYFMLYDLLIQELLTELPELKLMILEPFVLKGSATEQAWDVFYPEVLERAKMAKKIAQKYNLVFIPLQQAFENAASKSETICWLRDGVHPTPEGHQLIKKAWIEAFRTLDIEEKP